MKRYFKLWWIYTKLTAKITLQSRFGASLFILGKFIRFGMLLYFLVLILMATKTLAGFNMYEVIFFYATFNLIDLVPQFFLREVYRFRVYVIKGYFDYVLAQPVNALFKMLFGGSDILDIPLILTSLGFLIFSGLNLGGITLLGLVLYAALVLNALLIAFSFHILILGTGIISSEVDNTVMLYRDLLKTGQIPIDVYRVPVSFILTFIVPVGLMITFPVKALLNRLSPSFVLLAFIFSLTFFAVSYKFWIFALKRYQSASS